MQNPQDWLARVSAALDPSVVDTLGVGLTAGIMLGLAIGLPLGAGLTLAARGRSAQNHLAHLQDVFHSISSEALDRSSDRLLDLAGERMGALAQSNAEALLRREEAVDALVRPIRESLSRVDEKLQRVETERQGHHAALTRHLELVTTSNRDLVRETSNLSQALRSPNARGRWGELQLRRVVELAGMLEHCDFQEQATLENRSATGSDTRSSRPDLIVHLPGGREIAVDAKAPLQEYLAASEATDEASRSVHLANHAKHVRRHLDALGTRAYWSQLSGSPEFVVLFLPGEPFFAEALAKDPDLIERGVERKVLMAGPTTLIALLRAVAYGWQQEAMAENASAICDLGRELFDRTVTLNGHFETLGKKLGGAVDAYNQAMGSFEGRVQVTARRMADFGIADAQDLGRPRFLDQTTRTPRPVSSNDAWEEGEEPRRPSPGRVG